MFDGLRPAADRDPTGVAEAKAMLDAAYGSARRRDGGSRNGRPGGAFALADYAAAPSLFYADWTHPIPPGLAHLRAYLAAAAARPSFARAVDEAQALSPHLPARRARPDGDGRRTIMSPDHAEALVRRCFDYAHCTPTATPSRRCCIPISPSACRATLIIGRDAYFKRCWPAAGTFRRPGPERRWCRTAAPAAASCFYEGRAKAGSGLSVVEQFGSADGRIVSVEVFFGRRAGLSRGLSRPARAHVAGIGALRGGRFFLVLTRSRLPVAGAAAVDAARRRGGSAVFRPDFHADLADRAGTPT